MHRYERKTKNKKVEQNKKGSAFGFRKVTKHLFALILSQFYAACILTLELTFEAIATTTTKRGGGGGGGTRYI